MTFRLVGTDLLRRWYEAEEDPSSHVRMDEWKHVDHESHWLSHNPVHFLTYV